MSAVGVCHKGLERQNRLFRYRRDISDSLSRKEYTVLVGGKSLYISFERGLAASVGKIDSYIMVLKMILMPVYTDVYVR